MGAQLIAQNRPCLQVSGLASDTANQFLTQACSNVRAAGEARDPVLGLGNRLVGFVTGQEAFTTEAAVSTFSDVLGVANVLGGLADSFFRGVATGVDSAGGLGAANARLRAAATSATRAAGSSNGRRRRLLSSPGAAAAGGAKGSATGGSSGHGGYALAVYGSGGLAQTVARLADITHGAKARR